MRRKSQRVRNSVKLWFCCPAFAILSTAFSLFWVEPGLSQEPGQEFSFAVAAVEQRNYTVLEEILAANPHINGPSQRSTEMANCGLYCQFSNVFYTEPPGTWEFGTDLDAIRLLLQYAIAPIEEKSLLFHILSGANDLAEVNLNGPTNERGCYPKRELSFSVANDAILAGVNLGAGDASYADLGRTASFYYVHNMCHRVFYCAGLVENTDTGVWNAIGNSILDEGKEILAALSSEGALNEDCVSRIAE